MWHQLYKLHQSRKLYMSCILKFLKVLKVLKNIKVLVAFCLCVTLFYLSFWGRIPASKTSPPPPRSLHHEKARESYFAGAHFQALSYLKPSYEQILGEEEGCELVISVFAETKQLSMLEQAARRCLERGVATSLAAEALAMSLASVGQSQQALEVLESLGAQDARVAAAMAQLYVYTRQEGKARTLLLKAISEGEPWSPWLGRVFTAETFYRHKPFLKKIVSVLATKQEVVVDVEEKLLLVLKEFQMTDEARVVEKRLTPPPL